jgi:hypothetical protein
MGKLNAYQKRQILISFSIQTLSHTFINNLNCRSLANKNAFSMNNITFYFSFRNYEIIYFGSKYLVRLIKFFSVSVSFLEYMDNYHVLNVRRIILESKLPWLRLTKTSSKSYYLFFYFRLSEKSVIQGKHFSMNLSIICSVLGSSQKLESEQMNQNWGFSWS